MNDSTLPPDLGASMRAVESRVERLEMTRTTRSAQFVPLFMAPNALSEPTLLTPQGHSAAWTDQPAYISMWHGSFVAGGLSLSGRVYLWVETGAHTANWRITIAEGTIGNLAVPAVSIATGTTSTIGPVNWSAAIPTAALNGGVDPRGRILTVSIDLKRDAGAGRVGLAISQAPYNF